jgi:hypothetical protein
VRKRGSRIGVKAEIIYIIRLWQTYLKLSFYCVTVLKETPLLRLQLLIENLLIEHVHSDTSFWLLEIVDLVMAFIPHEKGKVPSNMASTHE